jgi:UDP-glucose 4-epimerase
MVVQLADSRSPIQFQSYTEAYDADFEDVRRRVPDLTRLKQLIDYRPKYDIESILRELIAEHAMRIADKDSRGAPTQHTERPTQGP